jgi:hypothetical protein
VDIALSEALALVLRDLGNSGAPVPDVRDTQWSNFPGQITAMLHDTDGTAQGVFAMASESLPQRIASVADQVQEWAVEALWRAGGPATWPEMPYASELPSADGDSTRRPRCLDLPKDRAPAERHRATARSGQIAPTRQAHARRHGRTIRHAAVSALRYPP